MTDQDVLPVRPLEPPVNELVIGPWTFQWDPDGLDPGVGNLTIRSGYGNDHVVCQTTQDDVQRTEWDAFVVGATL